MPYSPYMVHTHQPVTVEKKNDLQVDFSLRPNGFSHTSATYAVSNNFALRAGYSGLRGFDLFEGELIWLTGERSFSFIASSYSYQRNVLSRRFGMPLGFVGRVYSYNCEYHSPSIVVGLNLLHHKQKLHQLSLKMSYNVVQRYFYDFFSHNNSGKSSGFEVFDDEVFSGPLENFFSFHPSYSISTRKTHHYGFCFYFQAGLIIRPPVETHSYSFTNPFSRIDTTSATKVHPVVFPLNLSVGLTFHSSLKKRSKLEQSKNRL